MSNNENATNENATFEQWEKIRSDIVQQNIGLDAMSLPDLVLYRDEYDGGISAIASAANLVNVTSEEMGFDIREIAPNLASYV